MIDDIIMKMKDKDSKLMKYISAKKADLICDKKFI